MKKRLLFLSIIFLLSIIIIYGCIPKKKEITATGKSENWEIRLTYTLEKSMLYQNGNMVYLKDNPPKKIEWETIHPNNFPVGSAAEIEVYVNHVKEFRLGAGGGGSLNEGDNYENIKERIDEMSVHIQWEVDGIFYSETIELDVQD